MASLYTRYTLTPFQISHLCRSLAEGLQKDKAPGLPVFATALYCLPYILPESWDATRLAIELPGVAFAYALCLRSLRWQQGAMRVQSTAREASFTLPNAMCGA